MTRIHRGRRGLVRTVAKTLPKFPPQVRRKAQENAGVEERTELAEIATELAEIVIERKGGGEVEEVDLVQDTEVVQGLKKEEEQSVFDPMHPCVYVCVCVSLSLCVCVCVCVCVCMGMCMCTCV